MHFVMQIRAGGRHVLSTHLTYHAHTITEMQQGKPAAHTHTHTHTHTKEWHATATCPIVCSLILQHYNNCQLLMTY
jgi:hypothetical protein